MLGLAIGTFTTLHGVRNGDLKNLILAEKFYSEEIYNEITLYLSPLIIIF
jgi:hypothetical protein